jgi:RNA methyltransferase, TrmH family
MITKSTIKYIQNLQQKKHRDEYNQFIAEGPKVVNELLNQNIFKCVGIYCTTDWEQKFAQSFTGIDSSLITVVKDYDLQKISALSISNMVLAIFEKNSAAVDTNFKNKLTLLLEDIQDPGNLGTIIRTADWFGIENIICTTNSADCYNPKVVQSTMASLGRVQVTYTDVFLFVEKHKQIKKFAAVLSGKPLKSFGGISEGILMFGNESKGLSNKLIELANEKITIPQIGDAESLNIAIAAGIIMFELTGK